MAEPKAVAVRHFPRSRPRPNKPRRLAILLTIALVGVGLFTTNASASQVVLCDGKVVTINMNTNGGVGFGTGADDVILGRPVADTINASAGNDTICGGGGADTIFAGSGDDRVFGENGNDTIYGATGRDYIQGGFGDDTIIGQGGLDTLYGNGGVDRMWGMGSNDFMYGGRGNDIMRGNGGVDRMWGGPDLDQMWGGNLGDFMYGEATRDIMRGGGGADVIEGGDGNDDLFGDANTDDLNGGNGTDACDGGGSIDTAIFCETDSSIEASDRYNAYAWADQPGNPAYVPSAPFQNNPTGGAINATRSNVGNYSLTFAGLAPSNGGSVQVTAYQSNELCNPTSWTTTTVDVLCYDPSGNLTDSRYLVHYSDDPDYAYAYVSLPTVGTNPSFRANNPGGGTISASPNGVGDYSVQFGGYSPTVGGGNVQVSAHGSDANCTTGGWGGTFIDVTCFDRAGNPVESQYTVLYQGDPDAAWVFANQQSSASYTPNTFYSHNPTGGGVTITSSLIGQYDVLFAGYSPDRGHVQVTAHASNSTCTMESRLGSTVTVHCHDSNGNFVDSQFSALFQN